MFCVYAKHPRFIITQKYREEACGYVRYGFIESYGYSKRTAREIRRKIWNLYKNNTFKEQLFPFDAIPRIIDKDEFDYLERGLRQRVNALNLFLKDIYHDKMIIRDKVVPEEFIYASSGYLAQCEGVMPPKGIYSHISGIDLVQGKDKDWYILEDNLRVPSGASYPMIARNFCRRSSPKTFQDYKIADNRDFTPHVRIMKTGLEYVETAKKFGLPYIVTRSPRPYDTTTLNYNWQIWDTKAFSLYSTTTERIDEESAERMVETVLNFMIEEGILIGKGYQGYHSQVVDDSCMVAVRPYSAGMFCSEIKVGKRVQKGRELACITDPYDGSVREKIVAPVEGTVFFVHNRPMTYANTAVLKIVPAE